MDTRLDSPNAQRVSDPGRRPQPAPDGGHRLARAAVALGLFALVACGGGGGSDAPPASNAPSGLHYPQRAIVREVGETIAPLAPTVQGVVSAYSVDPPLPNGLSLDPTSGVIAGTALAQHARSVHVVKATGPQGASQFELAVEFLGPARFALVANRDDSTLSRFVVDGEEEVLQYAGYHALSPAQDGPERVVVAPSGLFAYALDAVGGVVSALAIDPATGELAEGSPVAIGSGPYSMALHPDGNHLYVVSSGDGLLRSFDIDPSTGALSAAGSPLPLSAGAGSLLVDPQGRFLLALHPEQGIVRSFSIDPATGMPAEVGSVSFAPGRLGAADLDPVGANAYVSIENFGLVAHMRVLGPEGNLEVVSTRPAGNLPVQVRVHPEGRFLYVLRRGEENIRTFALDPASGAPEQLADGPAAPATARLVLDGTGRSAWIVDPVSTELRRLSLDPLTGIPSEAEVRRARGAPTDLALVRGPAPSATSAVALYVASANLDVVHSFSVDPTDGTLTPLGPDVPVAADPRALAVDVHGRYLWVANQTLPEVRTLAIQPDGSLADTALKASITGRPRALVADPSGRFLYSLDNEAAELTVFAIGGDGSLQKLFTATTDNAPLDAAIDPTGQRLYSANAVVPGGGSGVGTIQPFTLDPRTGEATSTLTPAPAPGGPRGLSFSPDARTLYSALINANILAPYAIGASGGGLVPIPPGTGTGLDTNPISTAVHPDGTFAYVAFFEPFGNGSIALYDVDPADGSLIDAGTGLHSPRELYALGTDHPRDIVLEPNGRFLVVVNTSDVTVFHIDPADGTLTVHDSESIGGDPTPAALLTVLD